MISISISTSTKTRGLRFLDSNKSTILGLVALQYIKDPDPPKYENSFSYELSINLKLVKRYV